MSTLIQDLRYALRMLARSPGFTAVAVLTLALGIGANTAIFSLTDALLFRPFPVADRGRLIALYRQSLDDPKDFSSLSYPEYRDFRDQNTIFSELATYGGTPLSLTLDGETERIRGVLVSGNYFSTLGVRAALGRTFLPDEDQIPGLHPVVVVSDDFWRRRLHSDPNIVGRNFTLNGNGFTVIGVAPAGFKGLEVGDSPALWVPIAMHGQVRPAVVDCFNLRGCDNSDGTVGRLKPGFRLADAQAQVKGLAAQEATAYPEARKSWTVQACLLSDLRLGPWNTSTLLLMELLTAVVGLVLVIAGANVAGLLLARGASRQNEVSVRMALGASRTRLIRQFLTESVLLSLAGGVLALLLGAWTVNLLTAFELPGIDVRALNPQLDARVFCFGFLLSLVAGLILGTYPAFRSSQPDLVETLKESRRSPGVPRTLLRKLLVVSQIALSLLLLISAGLLTRTLTNLLRTNIGFDIHNVLVMSIDPKLAGYSENRERQFYRQLLERVRALPGVQSASLVEASPLSEHRMAFDVFVEDPKSGERRVNVDGNAVSPGFFSSLGVPLLRGRDFNNLDQEGSPGVAIVNETLARRFWPGEDPLGKQFWLQDFNSMGRGPSVEVIGVVKDVKYYRNWRGNPPLFVFVSIFQQPVFQPTLQVRVAEAPNRVIPAVRREARSLDPNLPLFNIKTMEDQFGERFLLEQMGAELFGGFSLLALLLAAVGLYGVVSYSVGQRVHEIGLRMALGAQRNDIFRLVVGQGMVLSTIGVAGGLCTALALTRLMASFLYEVRSADPLTYTVASMFLVGVALAASYLPARRAAKVDPMVALRYE